MNKAQQLGQDDNDSHNIYYNTKKTLGIRDLKSLLRFFFPSQINLEAFLINLDLK